MSSEQEEKSTPRLNSEQIENWRKVLVTMVGPYALLMPAAEVQKFRDRMQEHIDGTGR